LFFITALHLRIIESTGFWQRSGGIELQELLTCSRGDYC